MTEDMPRLFDDLGNAGDLKALGYELIARCRATEHKLLKTWIEEIQESLAGGHSGMRMKGQLLEISQDGALAVNYSSRLVQLLREVRQLSELGITVPGEIMKAAEEGEKYYQFGVVLKKVVNFFNSMDAQILKAQRPMLLSSLVAFEEMVERRVSRTRTVEWSTPTECENYVERLQQAAFKLARETRQLRGIHEALASCVVALMDVDMLRRRSIWKQRWQEIQSQMRTLSERYPADRMRRWVLHWDHQVCKVLEAAYCNGLETLNESQFSDNLKVELGFFSNSNQGILEFRPSIEELRALYYRELKKFISVPSAFLGLSGTNREVCYSRKRPTAGLLLSRS
jgi:dynein heavy chain 2|mmetsp:Transcript_32459/g.100445  ORF Transcript_32459/g.100445 Transcript_32459/m.100445 type:complete len:341 (+) Transcript_32459:2372-3394(+)